MSDTPETTEPRNDIERLFQEIAASANVEFRVDAGDGLFIVWLTGKNAPNAAAMRTPGGPPGRRAGT